MGVLLSKSLSSADGIDPLAVPSLSMLTTCLSLLSPSHCSIPSIDETRLTVISSLSLGGERVLSLLVLGNLVGGVLLADLTLAVY
jgi:hypothetical protein